MKCLVIAPQPFFSPRGTPFSVYYRTLVTAELGAEIDLLTYGEGQDVDIPGVRIIRIPRFRILGNVKIGPSFLKLYLDAFIVLWTIWQLLTTRYDFVHAHEEAVFFCRFLKPIFGFKLIYDMHSSLPQQLTNFKFTTSKIIIGIFKKLEDTCIQSADAVITICPDLSDYVNSIIKDRSKHLLIENSIFEPIKLAPRHSSFQASGDPEKESFFNRPPGKNQFIVYAGTLEPYQGIDILIKSFKIVVVEIPTALLIIVGGTEAQVKQYSELAAQCEITKHVLFTGQVPKSEAKRYCELASVQLSPRSAGTNTPLKVYEQLASGIPLVATNIYSHTQVLNDDVAILVEPTPDGMSRGIILALISQEKAELVSQNAKRLYDEKYSRPIYEKKMHQVLKLVS